MPVSVPLTKYHHIVIVAQNAAEAVRLWSRVFDFEAPKLNDLAHFFKMFNDPQYPSLLRGKHWDSDFKQAVFNQHSFFFEIDEPGTGDNFAEFVSKHQNGVAYIGLIAGEDRDAFLERLQDEYGCETVVEQYFPGGDWSVNYAEKVLGIDLCVKKLPGGDHTVNPVMPDFAGLTIVVDDLEEKLDGWRALLGAEKIRKMSGTTVMSGRGADREVYVKAAEISDGLFPIYLVEAGEEGPFAEHYRTHGSGVFHITVPADGGLGAKAQSRLRGEGFTQLVRYELFGRTFTVYDTVDKMGANISLA